MSHNKNLFFKNDKSWWTIYSIIYLLTIRAITKLPNSEQSNKGKVKTHKYIDKISQQPETCENRNDPDLVQTFLKKWWVRSISVLQKNLVTIIQNISES
jgi:hypothetical protein